MTLEQLRIFVAVAERQHLTQAAAILALTPSAVSAAIKSLEERYATVLFHRVGRRIALSEEGRIFLSEAQRLLACARTAEATLAELGKLPRGTLTICASQTIASYWLPSLLAQFRLAHPEVTLQLNIGNTETAADAVLQGAAELGFIEGVIDAQGLLNEVVGHDQMLIVVAPGHPWSTMGALQADDLLGASWILREPGSGTRSAFEAALISLGLAPQALKVALSLPSNEAVRSAVMTGAYAAAMSELVVAPHLAAGLLTRAGFTLPQRRFSMLRHPQRHRSRAVTAFESLVRSQQHNLLNCSGQALSSDL